MRPLRGGRPTFDRIVQNINETLSHDPAARITLRVNINQDNVEVVSEVFDYFPPELRPRLRLALEPIFGDGCLSHGQSRRPTPLEPNGGLVRGGRRVGLRGICQRHEAPDRAPHLLLRGKGAPIRVRPLRRGLQMHVRLLQRRRSSRRAHRGRRDPRDVGPLVRLDVGWEIVSHPTVRNASTCHCAWAVAAGCRLSTTQQSAHWCRLIRPTSSNRSQ